MKWTREVPVEDGYYWAREATDEPLGEPRLAELWTSSLTGHRFLELCGDDCVATPSDYEFWPQRLQAPPSV